MAPAITHFLVGASILLLLAVPVALRYRLSPWVPLWLVAIGGIWGLFPDLHHIAPVYASELRAFHGTRWADLFAFHYTLDRPVIGDQYTASVFGSIALFLGASSVFTLATQVYDRTSVAETHVPHSVALAVAAIPAILLIGALGSGLL